jgi:hypothetical protein
MRPRAVAPYQCRLDWLAWRSAKRGGVWREAWIAGVAAALRAGSLPVLSLFAADPLYGEAPKYVRVVLMERVFSTPTDRRMTGLWWTGREIGMLNID